MFLRSLKRQTTEAGKNAHPAEVMMLPGRFQFSAPLLKKVNRKSAEPAAILNARIPGTKYYFVMVCPESCFGGQMEFER